MLATARSIAPCLQDLEGEDRETAISILKGVVAEIPAPGSRRTKSMSRNGTSVSFGDVESAFSADDRAGLRVLCASARSGLPVGEFPPPSRQVARMWPEGS